MMAAVCAYTASLLVSFFLSPYIINTLGKELYSYFSIANNFVSYMSIISIALNSMAARYITIEEARGNHTEANCYFSSVFWGNFVLIAILSIISVVLILNLEKIFNVSESYVYTVQILFILIFVSMFVRLIQSVFSISTYVKNMLYLNSVESMVSALLRAAILFALYAYLVPSILYMGYVSLILSIMSLMYYFLINQNIFPESSTRFIFCKIKYMWRLISSGIWRSIESLGGLLLFNTDLIIANMMIGESAAGLLAIVHMFPVLLQGILGAITNVFLPEMTWLYGKNDIEGLIGQVKKAQRICGAIVSIPVCILIIMGKNFFDLWVPGNDSQLLGLLSVICIGYMPLFIVAWPIANLNVIMDKNKLPAIINVVMGGVNLITMILLIKYANMGLLIIPLTSFILQITYNTMFIPIYPCVNLGVNKWIFYPPIIKSTLEVIVVCVIGCCCIDMVEIESWGDFFKTTVILVIVMLFVNYMLWLNKNEKDFLCNKILNNLLKI